MKAKVVLALGIALGAATGTALYQVFRYGVSDVDWGRVLFVSLFVLLFFLIVPTKWIQKSRS